MAWASMHFAAGMAGGTLIAGLGCLTFRRGWRWIPAAMTLGGFWAMVPDMPRLFRVDFPGLPFAGILGNKALEDQLHHFGDLFFFHRQLDIQPKEYALHGLLLIFLFYNLAILILMLLEHRQRHSWIHRAARAHRPLQDHFQTILPDTPTPTAMAYAASDPDPHMQTLHSNPTLAALDMMPGSLPDTIPDTMQNLPPHDPDDPVIGRIGMNSPRWSLHDHP